MKKDVIVSFTSYNAYEDAQADKVVFETKGSFYLKDGKHYLKYDEQINETKVSNTLKIEEKKVTIMRFGEVNTQITVEQGKKHLNYYETGEGSFLMGIYGDRVDIDISGKKGHILLKYGVEFNNVLTTKNTIEVKFEEV
ncbi:MAG: DUF1934 domain-containing protein [Ruminococcaceae bacterium]|nr:DUF1934 domain-containing protein [Oscillospiraceae bacterium]